jgi:hypothetical protein
VYPIAALRMQAPTVNAPTHNTQRNGNAGYTNRRAKVYKSVGFESPLTPLTRGERAGSGGILHAQQFVNSGSAIGITRVATATHWHQF